MNQIEDLQHTGAFRPQAEPSLRWGVLGTSWITSQFITAAHAHTRQRVVAVGSRTARRSADFAAQFGIETAHGSYSALIEDSAVDAVYVGVTADLHHQLALEAIAAGKPVLVEKPFALTAGQAGEIRGAARSTGVFAMEAMWTRYLPQFDAVRLLWEQGALGDVEVVSADHGQALSGDPTSRLLRPDLGGGALLDLGVYPLAFASEFFGTPTSILAAGHLLPTGVDGTVGMVLSYEDSTRRSIVSTSIAVRTPTVASIAGSEARIDFDENFYTPSGFTLAPPDDGAPALLRWQDQSGIVGHQGLSYQATAFARFVGEGRTESPVHGLDESVDVLSTIERARAQLI